MGFDSVAVGAETTTSAAGCAPAGAGSAFGVRGVEVVTGARSPGFFHTENRQVPRLRELHRDPIVEIHPDAAAKEGI